MPVSDPQSKRSKLAPVAGRKLLTNETVKVPASVNPPVTFSFELAEGVEPPSCIVIPPWANAPAMSVWPAAMVVVPEPETTPAMELALKSSDELLTTAVPLGKLPVAPMTSAGGDCRAAGIAVRAGEGFGAGASFDDSQMGA